MHIKHKKREIKMKKIVLYLILISLLLLLVGCSQSKPAQIIATTKPVYQFTAMLCEGTPLKVDLLITENVSCLHDYSLQVSQMRKLEAAELIVINGAGFEDFLSDAMPDTKNIIDCSANVDLHCSPKDHHDDHNHENDPHIWLNIRNAKIMAETICAELYQKYPNYSDVFRNNLEKLNTKFASLDSMAQALNSLSCRELITFHDGFTYLAESFDLHIIRAIEEESGAEASVQELISIIRDVDKYNLPAIFTEVSGSSAAADVIHAETGVNVYELDMSLSERDYFEAMEHNIKTLKEALE